MAIRYGIEKFQTAVDSLADSIGPWRDRLFGAYLSMHVVQPEEDLPDELRQRAVELFQSMSRVKAQHDEGDVQATLNRMGDEEGRRIVHEIWSINDTLQARYRDAR